MDLGLREHLTAVLGDGLGNSVAIVHFEAPVVNAPGPGRRAGFGWFSPSSIISVSYAPEILPPHFFAYPEHTFLGSELAETVDASS
jgi:hypothetical protein